ncbi:hypothetical protein ZIOFF_024374 [Zingiber officinale]|uniref:Uncharacterized protein n=1 Tax=Zingiber officinale TaxID=94328 RepID=A0A8J5L675_ZINOF|nr:hypothetical protein ZIOFF_024374 [Zingiber officinale]
MTDFSRFAFFIDGDKLLLLRLLQIGDDNKLLHVGPLESLAVSFSISVGVQLQEDLALGYVLPGWEGSAADGRVLRDAISRRNGLKIPQGIVRPVLLGHNGETRLQMFPMEGKSQKSLKGVATAKDVPTSQPVLLSPTKLVESSMPMKKLMTAKVSSSNLKATPNIESRYKLLKRQFHAINEMINHSSGFGRSNVEKCITASKDVFDDWVKSHPAAVSSRNKEFPHLDDLMFVWGKDCATGVGTETRADAVEEINLCDEETDIFECEIDEHAKFHKDEEYVREETKKSEMETQDSVCPSNKATTKEKKRKSDDVLGDLVGEISKYVTIITKANEEMKGISTYFMKQTENSDKKMRIYDELMELSDFSQQEIMDVGEYILKDDHKVDNFFALPKTFRREYVMKQLTKINPYATN